MAARARRIEEEPTEPANDVIDIVRKVEADPALALTDEKMFEAYYAHVEQQALSVKVDLSTSAGRDLIRSAASEIARKKTAFDRTRKELTEDYRRKTATINAVGKLVVDRFAALQLRVRQPLTDYEEREQARKMEADLILTNLRDAAIVRADETAEDVERRLGRIRGINLNDELFGPRIEMAVDLRDDAVKALGEALARLRQQEAERAELERLRRADAERQEREARERQEREDREAEEARQRDEAARIERERQEAADKARRDAEEAAEAERRAVEAKRSYARDIIQHIKDVGLGMIGGKTYPYAILIRELEEKIVIDDAMGDMQDEVRAIRDATLTSVRSAMELAAARAAKEAQDEEDRRVAAERARREADQQHRSAVRTAAKEAIMTCGVDEDTARKIVLAIQAGEIPAVRIEF
ncbi:hypothetical protein OOT33_13495 [Sphingobium sp. DEHP117]|uniref:hypothetical protein n=1 Tax=Sphingobium sp. DEHP117 TaxID=2993436 RepID=UPI0027D70BB7|nr:hypothetical protein [Sphingobium sp. DEHP117]MDQ4421436.1 hypothetical protein [Sphingobium sp. DEHP117]